MYGLFSVYSSFKNKKHASKSSTVKAFIYQFDSIYSLKIAIPLAFPKDECLFKLFTNRV